MIVDNKSQGKIQGMYVIGDIKQPEHVISIAVTSKPNKIQSLLTRLILGWRWVSIERAKELGIK
jgi:hypothetical protein